MFHKNKKHLKRYGLLFILVSLPTLVFSADIDWKSVNGGGDERTSQNYKVYDAVGQSVSGLVTGTTYSMFPSGFVLPPSAPWAATFQQGVSMVSFPLLPDNTSPRANFGSLSGFDFARWDPSAVPPKYHYYSHGAANAFLLLAPGQGYWMKIGSQTQVNMSGVSVSEVSDYSIQLKKGWNQIGNPFNFNVDISAVKITYQSSTKTFSEAVSAVWVGNYAISYPNATVGYQLVHPTATGTLHTLEPWLGYWLYCYNDVTLLIPPSKAAKVKNSISSANGFSLEIKARVGDRTRSIFVGRQNKTEQVPLPPSPLQDDLEIYLGQGNERLLAEFGENMDYEFTLSAKQNENITLSIEKNNLPEAYSLYLTDVSNGKEIDMRNPYSYISDNTEKKFKLHISKVNKDAFSITPLIESIQFVPNPVRGNLNFNANLNIVAKFSSGLPVQAQVEIFNMAGKPISIQPVNIDYGGKGKVKMSSASLNDVILQLPNGVYILRITFFNAMGEKNNKIMKISVVR